MSTPGARRVARTRRSRSASSLRRLPRPVSASVSACASSSRRAARSERAAARSAAGRPRASPSGTEPEAASEAAGGRCARGDDDPVVGVAGGAGDAAVGGPVPATSAMPGLRRRVRASPANRASAGRRAERRRAADASPSMTTRPVRRVDDPQVVVVVVRRAAIARRKLSTVTSKCTIARLRPSACGISVAFAMTHSLVSGETYGAAGGPARSRARMSARRRRSLLLVDRSAGARCRRARRARTPRRGVDEARLADARRVQLLQVAELCVTSARLRPLAAHLLRARAGLGEHVGERGRVRGEQDDRARAREVILQRAAVLVGLGDERRDRATRRRDRDRAWRRRASSGSAAARRSGRLGRAGGALRFLIGLGADLLK